MQTNTKSSSGVTESLKILAAHLPDDFNSKYQNSTGKLNNLINLDKPISSNSAIYIKTLASIYEILARMEKSGDVKAKNIMNTIATFFKKNGLENEFANAITHSDATKLIEQLTIGVKST